MNPTVQRTTVAVNNWSKSLKVGGYRVPKGTVSYDIIKGISPKKGEFTIYQFKNELGKVIKSCHLYMNKAITSLIRNFRWSPNGNVNIRETKYQNDKEVGFSGTLFWKAKKGYTRVLQEKTTQGGFIHTLKYVKPHEKPEGLQYKYMGYSPCFACKYLGSVNNTSGVANTYLIPAIITSISSSKNTDAVIEAFSNYEQSKFKIKGFLEPVYRVSLKDLNPDVDFSAKEKERIAKGAKHIDVSDLCAGGYNPFTKKMAILKENKDLIYIMRTIAHETQHTHDALMVACLEDFDPTELRKIYSVSKKEMAEFIDYARKKFGIIKKDDPRYPEYKRIYDAMFDYRKNIKTYDAWENNPVESKSIPYEEKATEKFLKLIEQLDDCFMK